MEQFVLKLSTPRPPRSLGGFMKIPFYDAALKLSAQRREYEVDDLAFWLPPREYLYPLAACESLGQDHAR